MKKIRLTQGMFMFCDNKDYELLIKHKWGKNKNGYAVTYLGGGRKNPKYIYAHRLIMNTPHGLTTDHINGNKLDNCHTNLRICQTKHNVWNSKGNKNGTSKYKGVSWFKRDKKWAVYICLNYKKMFIGRFFNEIEAAKAYDSMAKKLFGNYAKLNFKV